jgi:hypothetical protein
MQAMPLPECLGTVVVHRGDAVTCTRDSCPRGLSLESWFSHHTSFVRCKTDECPHCSFNPRVENRHDHPTSSAGRLLDPAFRRQGSS